MNRSFVSLALAVVAGLTAASISTRSATPRFYDDDPIAHEVETRDAIGVQRKSLNLLFDEARSLFATPGDRTDRPALNVNTIDEVPDSSWFVDRIIARPPTLETLRQGPGTGRGPAPGPWTVVAGKSDGVTPGFTVLDAERQRWFVKFDPPEHPEMATGAEAVVTRLLHAIGYHVPENVVASVRRENLRLSEESMAVGADGRKHRLEARELNALLRRAATRADGSYRVIASRALPGIPVGPFQFAGTRPDDPNDVVPHEHRRELRALRVFSAWVNHVDTKAMNTLDTLVLEGDRTVIRHHLLDFGSTLGSAAVKPRDFDEGHAYIVEPGNLFKNALLFGFHVRPFEQVRYADLPGVGRFSAARFDPTAWKPRVPNPAFLRARPEDLFWGARRVMAFTDDMIRAAVATGRYSDPQAARHIAQVLIERRDRIGRTWMTAVNPVVAPAFDGHVLTFANAAVDAGVSAKPVAYTARWFAFDNTTAEAAPLGETRAAGPRLPSPDAVSTMSTPYLQVDLAAAGGTPARLVFKRSDGDGSWRLVGLERTLAPAVATATK